LDNDASINNTNDLQNNQQSDENIYLYSIILERLFPIQIGNIVSLIFTWSNNDSSLYLASIDLSSIDKDE